MPYTLLRESKFYVEGNQMRLESEFKRTGFFSTPNNPEKQFQGTLTISDGGDIELEITTIETDLMTLDDYHIGRLIGNLEKAGSVTLDDCFYINRSLAFGAPATSRIRVGRATIGAVYEAEEETVFSEFSFSIEGIDDWLRTSGIKVERSENTATIMYEPQQPIIVYSESGCEISICFAYTIPGFPTYSEAKITQSAYIKISTSEPQCFSYFTNIAYKITNLLCFATACSLSMPSVNAKVPDSSTDSGECIKVKLFYPSLPFSESKPDVKRHDLRFAYPQVRDRFPDILKKWLDDYELLSPALNLYFSTQNGTHKYLDSKFLSLMQGLETFSRRTHTATQMDPEHFHALTLQLLISCPSEKHDWLFGRLQHGNEISQANRIKKLIEPFESHFGDKATIHSIVRKIVDTRNYLTHYDLAAEKRAAKGRNLWILGQKLESIFELNIYKRLSFSDEDIVNICKFGNLKQKLSLLLE